MMKTKRGQITLFILLGVVLIIAIAFLYYMNIQSAGSVRVTEAGQEEFLSIEEFISTCITKSAAESGYYISEHGGWQYIPDDPVDYVIDPFGRKITRVYDKNLAESVLLLSLDEVEYTYAGKVRRMILACVDDFNIFKNMNYNVEYKSPQVTATILQNFSIIETNFPVTITKGDMTKKFNEFAPVRVPLRIGRFHEVAQYLINHAITNPSWFVPLTYLSDLHLNEDIKYGGPTIGGTQFYYLYDDTPDVALYSKLYNNDEFYAFRIGVTVD